MEGRPYGLDYLACFHLARALDVVVDADCWARVQVLEHEALGMMASTAPRQAPEKKRVTRG